MTRRYRVRHYGRMTNRINCPKKLHDGRHSQKLVSFDNCKSCDFAVEVYEDSVECSWPTVQK